MSKSPLYTERGQAIAKIMREYEQIMCRTCSTALRYDIEYYLERGMEAEVIIRAIEITQGKGADWRYTKAILKRLLEENTLTIENWECKVNIKKLLLEYKKKLPYSNEADILPYVIIKVYSQLPYFKNLKANMDAFVLAQSKEPINENWIDQYVEKD